VLTSLQTFGAGSKLGAGRRLNIEHLLCGRKEGHKVPQSRGGGESHYFRKGESLKTEDRRGAPLSRQNAATGSKKEKEGEQTDEYN